MPKPPSRLPSFIRTFIESEASGGLVLMAVALLAIVIANSPAAGTYFGLLGAYVGGLNVLHWINDGLMAVFFLLVGLEIKRELISGELSTWGQCALPGFAAAGGMAVPALVYLAFTYTDPQAAKGWAIPAATDIAFALGVLSLLGPRVPISLKVFLTALAIIDDLGAILIIALFYTEGLDGMALAGCGAALAGLIALNWLGVLRLLPYLVIGVLLWIFTLKSGVHATLAGVALAFTIPMPKSDPHSPLLTLEHALAPWVAFLVIPVFGFANAGVPLANISLDSLTASVPLGVAAGLFAGKQIGVVGAVWLAIRLGLAKLPAGAGWLHVYGVALLCGIGFTMSLFIGMLAFPESELFQTQTKLGVLVGSILSALAGAVVLRMASSKEAEAARTV